MEDNFDEVLTTFSQISHVMLYGKRKFRKNGRMGFLIKIGICVAEKSASISVIACFNVQRSYNYEISSHPLISASAFYEESKIVTFEDKSKESESGQKSEITSINKFKDSEKDSQKVEVTFKDEFKGSKKDDQATFEDGSEGLEKNDHNNQSPFISIDWHEWLERILEVSKELSIYKK
ncbi:unnamed protein product [Rhizophagus irregularis]|uniref:Uncharacterized protein n=1 Tax=Rhizophagus irregularis TaxID=588596 RepID=A0A915ZES2_9GLOM|nr:unnamed protein product [Rhizophagus irregularis]CAB5372356.1 unnamed protein product [Rhizophagus irregularis]